MEVICDTKGNNRLVWDERKDCFNELNSLINEITCKEAPAVVLSSQGTYQTSVLASWTSPKMI